MQGAIDAWTVLAIAIHGRLSVHAREDTMPASPQWLFDRFRLDPDHACLWRGPEAVALSPKAFAVLYYLVTHPGRLVSKDELLDAVWPELLLQRCCGARRHWCLAQDAERRGADAPLHCYRTPPWLSLPGPGIRAEPDLRPAALAHHSSAANRPHPTRKACHPRLMCRCPKRAQTSGTVLCAITLRVARPGSA